MTFLVNKKEKEIESYVRESIENGKTKLQLFEELRSKHLDNKIITKILSNVPSHELKKKFGFAFPVLQVILLVNGLIQLIVAFVFVCSAPSTASSIFLTPLALFGPALNFILAFCMRNKTPSSLLVVVPFGLIGKLSENTRILHDQISMGVSDGLYYLGIVIAATIVIGAIAAKYVIFPHYGFFLPKKDVNGDIIFQ